MNILILGGSGGIGSALVRHFLNSQADLTLYATYFKHKPSLADPRLRWLASDVSKEKSIAMLAAKISKLDLLINAVGVLQIKGQEPEKTITAFNPEFFEQNIRINTLPTLLLAKYFYQQLKAKHHTYFVSFSARIGSIEDNRAGGWISYRCSKAALNMAIKTISLEWKYKLANCCVLAFHPGTTNTSLSENFQKNVPAEKLFTPEYVANALLHLLNQKTPQDTGRFFDYHGNEIAW